MAKKKSPGPAAPTQTDVTPNPAAPALSEEEIRKRAYERYEQRGAGHGGDFDDWLEAEKDLRQGKGAKGKGGKGSGKGVRG